METTPANLADRPSGLSLDAYIERTPGVCGGKPRIAGHRITVEQIAVLHERLAQTVDEIAVDYPQLSLASIHAALAYYHDHRAEIDADAARGAALVAELRQRHPSKLLTKLAPPPSP